MKCSNFTKQISQNLPEVLHFAFILSMCLIPLCWKNGDGWTKRKYDIKNLGYDELIYFTIAWKLLTSLGNNAHRIQQNFMNSALSDTSEPKFREVNPYPLLEKTK